MCKSGKGCKFIMLCLFVVILSLSGYAAAAPLHEAAKEGDLAKVNRLIEGGADVNVRAENGATPLHFAADRGHRDVAELLISKGAKINAETETGYTPLHWAADRGHKDMAELLISKGANVNAKNNRGWTPLAYAGLPLSSVTPEIKKGRKDVIELLRRHGARK